MDYQVRVVIFSTYCRDKITGKNIVHSHITNMDEIPLTFDIPLTHTVEKKGTSMVAICTTGHEKLSFTVVLGCHGNGQKLPPMVIFKRKTLPKEAFPARVVVKANQKGWMDEEKMKEGLREVAFAKASINVEAEPVGKSDSDDEEEELGILDIEIAQLFNSDTEDENFDGFVAEE
ncbi:hypothetical protein D4764_01G0015610 [Takifugu flavidus]|uniref:DDE-1 domain-containing protein n=1 Tax=Takifugu flavidus TaxID=433684 RepID=A0A5C6PS41_9TELE|nr:hypothetical protein D4764_01G0015610 [Takifugu flavidus]